MKIADGELTEEAEDIVTELRQLARRVRLAGLGVATTGFIGLVLVMMAFVLGYGGTALLSLSAMNTATCLCLVILYDAGRRYLEFLIEQTVRDAEELFRSVRDRNWRELQRAVGLARASIDLPVVPGRFGPLVYLLTTVSTTLVLLWYQRL